VRVPRPEHSPGRPRKRPAHIVTDRGFGFESCRRVLRRGGISHTIPERKDHKERRTERPGRRPSFDREAYRRRNVVERCVNRLKQLPAIATPYEKPQGMGASMSVEGATDGSAFQTYVEHFLLPTLKKGQVVVMDNLQVHKSSRVRGLIEGVDASVLFLSAYSPDFSLIEEAFSKIKGILRTIEARTHEAPVEAIGIALQAVRPAGRAGLVRTRRLQRHRSVIMKIALDPALTPITPVGRIRAALAVAIFGLKLPH
jgi:transposase